MTKLTAVTESLASIDKMTTGKALREPARIPSFKWASRPWSISRAVVMRAATEVPAIQRKQMLKIAPRIPVRMMAMIGYGESVKNCCIPENIGVAMKSGSSDMMSSPRLWA